MAQHKNECSELDVQKYSGQNADHVIEELKKQGKLSDDQLIDYKFDE